MGSRSEIEVTLTYRLVTGRLEGLMYTETTLEIAQPSALLGLLLT